MALAHRQTTIWDDVTTDVPPGLKEVAEFLRVLSEFDGPLVTRLCRDRGHGRNNHPVSAMWNLFAVTLLLRHGKFTEMLGELR